VRTAYTQNNFLSGTLDPRASARVETDAYNNGALVLRNVVPIHLGGVRRRPGLRHAALLPNQLTRITSGVTITAPNGGTTTNANDDTGTTLVTTTNNVGTTDPYVVLHYDLGSAKDVQFVDCMDIFSTGGSSTEFLIQYSLNNSSWTALGDNFPLVDTTSRSFRRGHTVPSLTISMRYIRVVKAGGTDMGSVKISMSGMNVWQDSGTVSAVRLIPFEVSTEEPYMVVLTDRCALVVLDGEFVEAVPTPYESADLAGIDASSSAETMAMVHEDYAPRFFLRESATNFQCEQIDFDAVPQYDYADASSPAPVSDVQVVVFGSGFVQGDTFQLELEGAKTGAITYAGDSGATDQAATAANIERAVQKLYTVEGFTGVSCSRTGVRTYTVTFAAASANSYDLMSGISLSSAAAIAVTQSAQGTARSEDAWSATRGYPRTVAFYEGRLWFGGTRSLQQSMFGSEVNNILNFETLQGLADEPVFVTISGAQLNAINGLYAGRSLQIFTSGGEYRFVKEQGVPIVPGDSPVAQTAYGSSKIRPVSIDGATLFVQRTGKAVRDFRFNYEENAYDSLGVSSLAPHLINDVVDIAAWNGSREDEIGLVFVVNGDGTIALLNTRKEAQVQAWVDWTTQGLFKAVGVVFQDRYFAVERTINGTTKLFLEIADEDYYTDCAAQTSNITTTGIDSETETLVFSHLSGEEVRVRVDGFALENDTVSVTGRVIFTGLPAPTLCEAGLDFNPTITPMPLNTMTPQGANFMEKRKPVKVWVRVRNTLGLRVNGVPLSDRFFDLNNYDSVAETVSGNFSMQLSSTWDEKDDKTITFDQVDPMPLEILGFKVQMESST
jgi:hypothetical protein